MAGVGKSTSKSATARTKREAALLARCKALALIARVMRAQRDEALAQGANPKQQATKSPSRRPRPSPGFALPKNIILATEFETLLRQELDIESALRTTLEFLLRRVGTTNAAIYLPQTSGDFSLGAYVNYDFPRERAEETLEALGGAIAPRYEHAPGSHVLTEAMVAEAQSAHTAMAALLPSTAVVHCCRDARECLCVMVVFRDRKQGFDTLQRDAFSTIGTIFGQQLARIAQTHSRHLHLGDDDRSRDRKGDGPGMAA